MAAFGFGKFQFGLMLATGIVWLLPVAGWAYTPEQEQACSGDAFRLCSAEIPDVDRVTVCMIRNKSQLSPGCRVFFRESEAAVTPAQAARPLSIRPETGRGPASVKPRKSKKPDRPDDT